MNAQKSQTKAPKVDALTTPTPVSENTASGHGVREEQRKKMMQWWSDQIAGINRKTSGKMPSKKNLSLVSAQ